MKPTEPPSHKASAPQGPLPPKATAGQGQPSQTASAPHGQSSPIPYDDGVPHYRPGEEDELHNVDVAHEHVDVNLRAVGMSAVILAIVVIVSQVLMYGLFEWFESEAAENDPQLSPLSAPATQMPASTTASPEFSVGAAGPQLLTNEPMALQQLRAGEQKRLLEYGWVDEKAGIAHIPIDQAKKLILDRGLPVREGASAPLFGVRGPARGESSGGRTVTAEPPEPAEVPEQQAPQEQLPPAKPHGGGH